MINLLCFYLLYDAIYVRFSLINKRYEIVSGKSIAIRIERDGGNGPAK